MNSRSREATELNEGFVPTWERVFVCGERARKRDRERV